MTLLGRIAALAALVTSLMVCLATPSLAERKVALVIGNSSYRNVPELGNPTNDAGAIAALFKSIGFEVVESRRDVDIAGMRKALRDFTDTAQTADIAVIYYAGHGIEVDGTNYLIPVDATLSRDTDVEDEAISLDRVMRQIEPAKRLRLVILDACRDNPFAKTMKRTIGTRSISRGLAKIEPNMSDTLVAFAAKAGSTASDGDGKNSPFTSAMLKHLATPGVDLRIAFGRVRDEVMKSTKRQQEPFVYGSLGGETVALVPGPPPDANAGVRRDYEFAAQIGTKQAWESFLAVNKTGLYADLARAQYDKLKSAEQASAKADAASRIAQDQAQKKFDEFKKQATAQAAREADDTKRKLSEQAKHELDEAKGKVAEQMQRELELARQQVEEAKRQSEAAQREVEAAKRQAVEDARRQVEQAKAAAQQAAAQQNTTVAALSPAPPAPAVPAVPALDPADLGRLLQAHLKRVGCDPGVTDGSWGESSRQALARFNTSAGTQFDVKLANIDALDAVRTKQSRVCPLVCGSGQKIDGERCVKISCDAGFALGADGACHKRPEPAPKPVARHETQPREPRAAASGGGGGKCFNFNGKRFCE